MLPIYCDQFFAILVTTQYIITLLTTTTSYNINHAVTNRIKNMSLLFSKVVKTHGFYVECYDFDTHKVDIFYNTSQVPTRCGGD